MDFAATGLPSEPAVVYLPRLPSYPHEQQDERDASCALQSLLPPVEFARHFDLDRVGNRHAVRLGNVCRVVLDALNVLRVPPVSQHEYGVSILIFVHEDGVMQPYRVSLLLRDVGRVRANRLNHHCTRIAAGQQSDEEQNENEGENHSDCSDKCSQHLIARIFVVCEIVVRYHRLSGIEVAGWA